MRHLRRRRHHVGHIEHGEIRCGQQLKGAAAEIGQRGAGADLVDRGNAVRVAQGDVAAQGIIVMLSAGWAESSAKCATSAPFTNTFVSSAISCGSVSSLTTKLTREGAAFALAMPSAASRQAAATKTGTGVAAMRITSWTAP
jgi:hypothetical protein